MEMIITEVCWRWVDVNMTPGFFYGYIELYNPTNTTVDLNQSTVTDNDDFVWTINRTVLVEPNQFVIFCDQRLHPILESMEENGGGSPLIIYIPMDPENTAFNTITNTSLEGNDTTTEPTLLLGWNLDEDGDDVYLLYNGTVVDAIGYSLVPVDTDPPGQGEHEITTDPQLDINEDTTNITFDYLNNSYDVPIYNIDISDVEPWYYYKSLTRVKNSTVDYWTPTNEATPGWAALDLDDDSMNDVDEVENFLDPHYGDDAVYDFDHDNLSNREELNGEPNHTDAWTAPTGNHTDPWDADTDGDGYPDGWEVENGYDPLDPLSPLPVDSDQDGVSDTLEELCDSNASDPLQVPDLVDTDGDGIPDLLDPDDDNDAIPDEVEEQYDCLDPTNPYDAADDFDDDGYSNYIEWIMGSDPEDPDSTPAASLETLPDGDGDGIPLAVEEDYAYLDENDPSDATDDDDGDGYSNYLELILGTDPSDRGSVPSEPIQGTLDSDDDGDGIPDNVEENYTFLDAYQPNDGAEDSDGDGYCDFLELILGSDPADADATPTASLAPLSDSDGDGVPDFLDPIDDDPTIYPGAVELFDFQDNDWDGAVDENKKTLATPGPEYDFTPYEERATRSEERASSANGAHRTRTLPHLAESDAGHTENPHQERYALQERSVPAPPLGLLFLLFVCLALPIVLAYNGKGRGRYHDQAEALSPIVSTILLVAIVLALTGIFYIWLMSSQQQSMQRQNVPTVLFETRNADEVLSTAKHDQQIATVTLLEGRIELASIRVLISADGTHYRDYENFHLHPNSERVSEWNAGESLIVTEDGVPSAMLDIDGDWPSDHFYVRIVYTPADKVVYDDYAELEPNYNPLLEDIDDIIDALGDWFETHENHDPTPQSPPNGTWDWGDELDPYIAGIVGEAFVHTYRLTDRERFKDLAIRVANRSVLDSNDRYSMRWYNENYIQTRGQGGLIVGAALFSQYNFLTTLAALPDCERYAEAEVYNATEMLFDALDIERFITYMTDPAIGKPLHHDPWRMAHAIRALGSAGETGAAAAIAASLIKDHRNTSSHWYVADREDPGYHTLTDTAYVTQQLYMLNATRYSGAIDKTLFAIERAQRDDGSFPSDRIQENWYGADAQAQSYAIMLMDAYDRDANRREIINATRWLVTLFDRTEGAMTYSNNWRGWDYHPQLNAEVLNALAITWDLFSSTEKDGPNG